MFNQIKALNQKNKYLIPFILICIFIIAIGLYASTPKTSIDQQGNSTVPVLTHQPETSIYPSRSDEETYKRLAEGDAAFAKSQADIQKNYPWYDKLPLQAPDYFVYFDVDKKAFVGLLYPANTTQNQIISETVDMKAEIRRSLTDIGIDHTKYEFQWEIKPEVKANE